MTDWLSIQLLATHSHQGKAFFPPVEEFNYMGYRENKRKSIVKVLFHCFSQSDVLEYVSWTNQNHKNKIKDSVSSPSNR